MGYSDVCERQKKKTNSEFNNKQLAEIEMRIELPFSKNKFRLNRLIRIELLVAFLLHFNSSSIRS